VKRALIAVALFCVANSAAALSVVIPFSDADIEAKFTKAEASLLQSQRDAMQAQCEKGFGARGPEYAALCPGMAKEFRDGIATQMLLANAKAKAKK
jgi:hypothetical protein